MCQRGLNKKCKSELLILQHFETEPYHFIELEYLRGGTLKRVFEHRLNHARKVCPPKNSSYKVLLSNDSDGSDIEIPKKYELLELGKRIVMSAPLFTEEEVSSIIGAVLKGLKSIHEINYIHRDVKPENIMLQPLKEEDRQDRCRISLD